MNKRWARVFPIKHCHNFFSCPPSSSSFVSLFPSSLPRMMLGTNKLEYMIHHENGVDLNIPFPELALVSASVVFIVLTSCNHSATLECPQCLVSTFQCFSTGGEECDDATRSYRLNSLTTSSRLHCLPSGDVFLSTLLSMLLALNGRHISNTLLCQVSFFPFSFIAIDHQFILGPLGRLSM